jgi:polyphosphate kinase 2 (PPK2 family)
MVAKTSTDTAPWQIVAANNKYQARLEVVEAVCAKIREKLAKK